jgi:predicted glycosyltransferase involved in capsule biosynthesis
MREVICVPWRPVDARRKNNWAWLRRKLEKLDWPIYEGDADGEWSIAQARNAAADAAGDWDVALFADADTIVDLDVVRQAAEELSSRQGAIRPHDHLYHLTKQDSSRVLRNGHWVEPGQDRFVLGGGDMLITRGAFEEVGHYSPAFVGWGHEDSYMGIELAIRGLWSRLPGNAYHLWHKRDPTMESDQREVNRARMNDALHRHRRELERESTRLGFDVAEVL